MISIFLKLSLFEQYHKLFSMDNINLSIEQDVYNLIVDYAYSFNLGARGLRSICEKLFLNALYTMPTNDNEKKDLIIDLKYAKDALKGIELEKLKEAS